MQAFLLCTLVYLTVGACGYAAFRARQAAPSASVQGRDWTWFTSLAATLSFDIMVGQSQDIRRLVTELRCFHFHLHFHDALLPVRPRPKLCLPCWRDGQHEGAVACALLKQADGQAPINSRCILHTTPFTPFEVGFLGMTQPTARVPSLCVWTALQVVNLVIPNMGRRAAAFREHVVTTAVLSTALALAVMVPNVEVRGLLLILHCSL